MKVIDDLMTTQDVATLLECSPQWVKKLVNDGRLPAPERPSDRIVLHRRVDVELYRELAAGGTATLLAALLPDAANPLRRIVDLIYTDESLTPFSGVRLHLHVRVWRGTVDGVARTVVLVSALHGSPDIVGSSRITEIAARIDRELLAGQGRDAVWLVWLVRTPTGDPELINVILRDDAAPRRGSAVTRLLRGPATGRWEPTRPTLRPLNSIRDLDRLVGSPVEIFAGETYTADAVERWQRSHAPVDILTDHPYRLHELAGALHILLDNRSAHPRAAKLGARVVADHLRDRDTAMRRSAPETRNWIDLELSQDAATVPADLDGDHLAARLVCIELDRRDYAALEDAGAPASVDQLPEALEQLRDWAALTDPYAENPDPDLHAAVDLALNLVIQQLRFEGLAVPAPVIAEPYVSDVVGETGRRFLAQITWQSAESRRSPRHRKLAEQLIDPTGIRFGADLDGNLVAHGRDGRFPNTIAVEWPDDCPAELWDAATAIVADTDEDAGQIVVYLEAADGLHLLPRGGFHHRYNGWSFGYAGSAPGHLTQVIITLLGEHEGLDLDLEDRIALRQWLEVRTDQPGTHLHIPLAQLKTQAATAAARPKLRPVTRPGTQPD
ncbi:helix-turn-helix transcriptional regulator [Nocardia nova]|uniref:helix-turn-helix transcriptional regulator n=1 Tax=Nocardia nova TaxID=37330 RepID=UPI0033C644E6